MILATPGPVEIPLFVRETFLKETIHHRTPEFKEILLEALERFKKITHLPNAVFLSSSGTGAMEAAVINSVKKKALTINAGKFGERWGKICEAHGIEFKEIKYDWDTPASVDEVIAAIEEDKDIDTFFIQISESAGGLRHPVEEIAAEIKLINPDIVVVADGITALGVEDIDTSNIDIVIGGSQKAFMLPPGLAMLGLSDKAVERIGKGRGFYFNLANEIKKQKEGTTAFTPATSLIIALNEVMKKLEEIGLDKHYETTAKRHKAVIAAIEAIGLSIFPQVPALSMAAVYFEKAEELRKILKTKYEVNVAGGQDFMKGKLFRINNMGLIEDYKMEHILNSVELALDELGIRKYDATAVKVYSNEKLR
ncbi:pyridoxal-phosphate-dependent aminotransferase family protein [Caminibacter pacificus]|uniref:Alanine--glyoxylate aminotransferase family protein n=1 Tax=Caminibacter pacificus TaxID=1424653 RepID=A0AAJ4UXA4_9BACT|nr:alanine--glyoxylate aminotransferase family protein [Caminibacter pacificus]QCI29050.1 alanine--glyoxylate aminotransferase family protein [Caminibacter pacificus]ROR39133.1 aspartate aminotransferase-like enzyme [Caminibacter pacificus]